jgi:hypothetical protein
MNNYTSKLLNTTFLGNRNSPVPLKHILVLRKEGRKDDPFFIFLVHTSVHSIVQIH